MEGRLEPDAESRPALRPAVPRDRSTRTPTTSRRRLGFAWSPSAVAGFRRFAAAPDCSSTACRCARSPTPSCRRATRRTSNNLHQPSVSGIIPTQAGAPTFPNILPAQRADDDARGLHDDGQEPAERVLEAGQRRGGARARCGLTVSVGYQYLRGENLLMSVNQNVPTCVAAGTNNGCRPNSTYRNNSQYSSVAESTYHGLHVSFVQRPTTWASVRVTLHAVEVDEQRRRGVLQLAHRSDGHHEGLGAIRRRPAPSPGDQRHRQHVDGASDDAWEHISHGFQVSSIVQYYSALPFNITSGVANLQGTNSRPLANGATAPRTSTCGPSTFIPRNAGVGSDFFSLNLRVSRAFRMSGDVKVEGLVEAFNLTNRANPSDAKRELRARRLSRRTRCRRSTRSPPSAIREPSSSACD